MSRLVTLPKPHRRSDRSAFLSLCAGGMLLAACSGSTIHVTGGKEAVGRAPSKDLSTQCGEGEAEWRVHQSPHGLFALEYPSTWTPDVTSSGHFIATDAEGTLSLEASAAWLPNATDRVPTLQAQRFADLETLSPWSTKARSGGYVLEGIMREGGKLVIARYLVAKDRYVLAIIRSAIDLDDGCRSVVLRALGSVVLRETSSPGRAESLQRAPSAPAAADESTAPASPSTRANEGAGDSASSDAGDASTESSAAVPGVSPQTETAAEPAPETTPEPKGEPAAPLDLRPTPR